MDEESAHSAVTGLYDCTFLLLLNSPLSVGPRFRVRLVVRAGPVKVRCFRCDLSCPGPGSDMKKLCRRSSSSWYSPGDQWRGLAAGTAAAASLPMTRRRGCTPPPPTVARSCALGGVHRRPGSDDRRLGCTVIAGAASLSALLAGFKFVALKLRPGVAAAGRSPAAPAQRPSLSEARDRPN